jgi:hypothetical protein
MRPYRSANGGWWPTFYYWEDVWIAGNEKKGTIYFYERPSPDENELGPPLYIYESTGEPDPPEKAMFLPAGTYLVLIKGECFHAYKHTCRDDMYFYVDDGTGAQKMSAELTTDESKYGREDSTAVLRLQITDVDTGEYIEVDTVFGSITLPDGTQKTLEKETWKEDWLWNDTEKWYEYTWGFTNDSKEYSDPKEGFYEVQVYVKKQYYQDIQVKTKFGVCYHVEIDLEFDKDIPEYSLVESVEMMVYVTDENGAPVTMGIESVLIQPDGTKVENLLWTQTNPGVYAASFEPTQDGSHYITVGVKEDVICYLEEAFGEFYVKPCEKAFIDLDITGTAVDEEVILVLTITDSNGNMLSEGIIESGVHLLNYPPVSLTWIEKEAGIYEAVYVPSEFGSYSVEGTVIVFGEEDCFEGSFEGGFIIEEKNLPDLIIRNEDIVITPEPHLGETVIISVTVLNWGNADAENFKVVVLMNDTLFYEETIAYLAEGESITLEIEWTIWYSGSYIIQAIADPPEGII